MVIVSTVRDRIDNPLAAAQFIADWAEHIAAPGGPLPGSALTDPQPTRYGYAFTARLARGRHVVQDAIRQARPIADCLALRPTELVVEAHPRIPAPSVCKVEVISHSPTADTGR